ncbi:MAG TPA: N-acetylmuramoyl-L-alanine amidase [Terracidiphilus sp.]|nr:N-acetylmuramoyl-L-alanine amidase [Terracidiphilus sp.]
MRFPWAAHVVAILLIPGICCSSQTPSAQRYVVVIDAAHGGSDPGGTLSSGQPEKSATLALSVRLRSLLAARGIGVVTTREADADVLPNDRAAIANHANAQVCLNLHASETGSGIHLFVSSLAPAQPARFVPWKTAQAASIPRSIALAGALNAALLHAGMNVTLGRTALITVDSMTCPAVAIELAPQRGTENQITAQPDDPDYQARVATVLATALLEWRSDASQVEARRP